MAGNKDKLVMGQINLGRGEAAWEMVGKIALERNWNMVLLQEPYGRGRAIPGYEMVKLGGEAKVAIWAREN